MVRTKDVKVVLEKSSRKKATSSVTVDKTSKGGKNSGGGNPYCPRETPDWQKPITNFFQHDNKDLVEDEVKSAGPSDVNSEEEGDRNISKIVPSCADDSDETDFEAEDNVGGGNDNNGGDYESDSNNKCDKAKAD